MREALVRHAIPQKSWPIVAIRITIFAAHGSSEEEKIDSDEPRPSLVTTPTLVAANVIASRTSQPISTGPEDRAPDALCGADARRPSSPR